MTKIKFYKGNIEYREPHPRSDMIPPSKRIIVFSLRYLTEREHKIIDNIWKNHRSRKRYMTYKKQLKQERKTVSCNDIKELIKKFHPYE